MRQGEVVELEIPSAPEYVSIVRHAIEGIARRMRFDAGQIEDLKLAVGEACTNAVTHSGSRVPASVGVRCVVGEDSLVVEIRNQVCGKPAFPEVCRPDISNENGRGLYLIRQLVDEVEMHRDRHTAVVRMLKRFAPAQAG